MLFRSLFSFLFAFLYLVFNSEKKMHHPSVAGDVFEHLFHSGLVTVGLADNTVVVEQKLPLFSVLNKLVY